MGKNGGFTLLELVLAIALMTVLSGVVLWRYQPTSDPKKPLNQAIAQARYLSKNDKISLQLWFDPSSHQIKLNARGKTLASYPLPVGTTLSFFTLPDTPFDPNYHMAIGQIESEDYESGQVVEVVQQGYKMDDAVIRPARVVIAK